MSRSSACPAGQGNGKPVPEPGAATVIRWCAARCCLPSWTLLVAGDDARCSYRPRSAAALTGVALFVWRRDARLEQERLAKHAKDVEKHFGTGASWPSSAGGLSLVARGSTADPSSRRGQR